MNLKGKARPVFRANHARPVFQANQDRLRISKDIIHPTPPVEPEGKALLVEPVLFSSKSGRERNSLPSRPTPSCFPGKSGRAQDKQKHRPLLVETDPTHPVVQFRTGLPRPTRPSERAQHSAQAKNVAVAPLVWASRKKRCSSNQSWFRTNQDGQKRLVKPAQPVLFSMQTRAEIRAKSIRAKSQLVQPVQPVLFRMGSGQAKHRPLLARPEGKSMARPTRPAFFKQIKQLVQPIYKSGLESARTGPGTRGARNPSEVHSKSRTRAHARVSARQPLRTYARAPARATRTHPRTHLVARRASAPPPHGRAPRAHGFAPHAPCAHARARPPHSRTRALRVRMRAPRVRACVSAVRACAPRLRTRARARALRVRTRASRAYARACAPRTHARARACARPARTHVRPARAHARPARTRTRAHIQILLTQAPWT